LVRTSSAIWETFDGTHDRIQAASRQAGGAFGPTQTFSNAVGSTNNARLAVDPQGNALAVWSGEDFEGTNGLQAAFRPAGGAFSPPQTLSDAGGSASQFTQIAVDALGNALAVWRRSDGTNLRIQASFRPADGTFGPAQTLSNADENAGFQQFAFDAQGNALAVWEASDGSNERIRASFRPAGGPFGLPQTISNAGPNAFLSQVVFDAQGNALVVWNRFDGAKAPRPGCLSPSGRQLWAAVGSHSAGRASRFRYSAPARPWERSSQGPRRSVSPARA
jgi:hypothetical protein